MVLQPWKPLDPVLPIQVCSAPPSPCAEKAGVEAAGNGLCTSSSSANSTSHCAGKASEAFRAEVSALHSLAACMDAGQVR